METEEADAAATALAANEAADALLRDRGRSVRLDAWVIAALPLDGGATGFALADGRVALMAADGSVREVAAHAAGLLCAARDPSGGVLSGGEDSRLVLTAPDGTARELLRLKGRWIEHLACHGGGRRGTWRAAAAGREVHLLAESAAAPRVLAHPATVAGLATEAKGRRLSAAHYNGASLWWTASQGQRREYPWKGSHTAIALAPDGSHIVTAMQENALHGWRLSDGADMRMSGYPAKPRSLSFSANGKWLASSGSESVVLWPFFGGGPMGKAPAELMGGDASLCTVVACHPAHEVVAAGWNDGLVAMAEIASARVVPVCGTGRGAVSALAWSADGARLAFGTETGFAAVLDLSRR